MPRKPRIEYAGAVYHVMSRGDHGEPVFHEDTDRDLFLRCVSEVCEKTGWMAHAYVLMTNHYHLCIETPEANLVVGMKWLQGTYTQRFNHHHRLRGHLFQGRYKSVILDEEGGYTERVARYIHLNPVRAGLMSSGNERLKDYPWSSYPMYLVSPGRRPAWLRTGRVLGVLALEDDRRGRKNYEAYIQRCVEELRKRKNREEWEEEWKVMRCGWMLGGTEFRERMIERIERVLDRGLRASYTAEEVRTHDEAEAERIMRRGLQALGIAKQNLQNLPKGAREKQVLAWLIRKQTAVDREWISRHLVMGDISRVTKSVRIVEESVDGRVRDMRRKLSGIPKFPD